MSASSNGAPKADLPLPANNGQGAGTSAMRPFRTFLTEHSTPESGHSVIQRENVCFLHSSVASRPSDQSRKRTIALALQSTAFRRYAANSRIRLSSLFTCKIAQEVLGKAGFEEAVDDWAGRFDVRDRLVAADQ